MMKKFGLTFPKIGTCLALFCLTGSLLACGPGQQAASDEASGHSSVVHPDGNSMEEVNEPLTAKTDTSKDSTASEAAPAENSSLLELKERFGEHCIAEQTFQVTLSEYDYPVYFVPYKPSNEQSDFSMQIVGDDEVLTTIDSYVPASLEGEKFTSLDAVAFFDVNYDGATDIVLILTYGNTSFASIYYGYEEDGYGEGSTTPIRYFSSCEELSETVTHQVNPLSISEIRTFLSDGKSNGEFSSWQEAYEYISKLSSLESSEEYQYDLIHTNEDDIPELVFGKEGYWVSLYTYHKGTLYPIINHWFYGVAGNSGYLYCPGKNSFLNYNTDYAGAILYTTYMSMNDRFSLDTVVQIVQYNFDDANNNGILDEAEYDSVGQYGVTYIDGKEVSEEECEAYSAGEYEYITGTMSLEELTARLKQ